MKIPIPKSTLGFGIFFIASRNYIYVDSDDHHNLIIGTTGSGKSFSFILPMLCLLAMTGESGLCVDIKGELSQATAELFKKKGYRVYFLDFIDPENCDCWNPLFLGSNEYMKQLDIQKTQEKTLRERLNAGKEEFEILHGKVADQKAEEEGKTKMEKVLMKKIIRNEVYNEIVLTKELLANHLFYQCHFVNCNTDDGTSLSSSSDFKECNFLNSKLHFIDVDKTSFDDCTFQNVSLKGNFIHVSFAGSKFSNLLFAEGSTFIACQLDNTNATEYFEDENIKLSNIELVKRNNEKDSNAVSEKIQELYEILKKEDSQLQNEHNQKKRVEENDVLDYMSSLDNLEYVKLIAKTSKKVVEEKEML